MKVKPSKTSYYKAEDLLPKKTIDRFKELTALTYGPVDKLDKKAASLSLINHHHCMQLKTPLTGKELHMNTIATIANLFNVNLEVATTALPMVELYVADDLPEDDYHNLTILLLKHSPFSRVEVFSKIEEVFTLVA